MITLLGSQCEKKQVFAGVEASPPDQKGNSLIYESKGKEGKKERLGSNTLQFQKKEIEHTYCISNLK